MKFFFLLVLLVCAVAYSHQQTLDVHCEFPQVVGKWTFFMTENNFNSSIVQQCSWPSKYQPTTTKQITLTLGHPNIVTDESGNQGVWTLLVDNGFDIKINNVRMYAYFRFVDHWFKTISYCNETFVGTFHEDATKPQNWGCFYGNQISKGNKDVNVVNVEKKVVLSDAFLDTKFKNNLTKIEQINKSNLKWKAKAYPQFEGMSYRDLIRKTGGKIMTPLRQKARAEHMERMKPFLKQYSLRDVPDKFDWRNVNGTNYVSPVRDQEQCGSCFAFSSMAQLESRVRIATQNKQKPTFAPQIIMDCDVYNEACNGGLEFMVSKYANDFGVVTEDCLPYEAYSNKCKAKPCFDQRTYVKPSYGYIGGYYGACSEASMMNELVSNGPFTVGFDVLDDFFNYESGIYQCAGKPNPGPDPVFVTINHAVEVVGYGVDGKGKYASK